MSIFTTIIKAAKGIKKIADKVSGISPDTEPQGKNRKDPKTKSAKNPGNKK